MLVADLRHDLVQTRLAAHRDLSPGEARALFEPMLAEARRLLDADRVPRRTAADRDAARHALCRAILRVADPDRGFSEAEWAALVPAFHAEHARRFGHSDPEAPVEIVSFGGDRHRADRHAGTAAPAAGRSRAAGGSATAAAAGPFSRRASGRAPAGPSARYGGARRCSPETRSPGRRSSRKFRRRRCSTRATAPMSMRSAA